MLCYVRGAWSDAFFGTGTKGRVSLFVICATAGFTRGVSDPLFFEMSADVAHPAPASTAGSILTFIYHVVLAAALLVPAALLQNWALLATAAVMVCSAVLVAVSKVQYARR